jgi:hypothetical protein
MYDALLANRFSEDELLGVLPELKFDDSAPFPVGVVKVKAQVVEDGKIKPLGDAWLPVPNIEKW